jgi:site-specific recombinase XerD
LDLGRAIEQYLTHLRDLRRSPNSVRTYDQRLRRFQEFLEQSRIAIEHAPRDVLDRFVGWLCRGGSGRKPAALSTCYCTVAAVQDFRKQVGKQGLVLDWADPSYPGHETPQMYIPESRDVQRFLDHLTGVDEPYATLLFLLPASGLRIEEACSLPASSVQVLPRDSGGVGIEVHVIGKGRKPRTVPVLVDAVPRIVDYLRGYRRSVRSAYMFPHPAEPEDHVETYTTRRRLIEVRETLGNKRLTPHRLRAYYATRLLEAGVDSLTLAAILGHSSVATTQRYAKPRGPALRAAIAHVRMVER